MRRQNLWIAMLAATATLGTSVTYADFIDDSNVQLKFKNFYLDRQIDEAPEKNFGSWTQGVILDAKSGYQDLGSVQVGADILVQHAFKLHGRDKNPDWILPHDGQKSADHFGKVGVTLKAKVSETELRIGEILPVTPVVHFDPSRQLLTTYEGVWLESKDIDKTKITLGYLDGINARYENQVHNFGLWPRPLGSEAAQVKPGSSNGMYVAGVDYQLSPQVGLSYFYGDVTNIYRQNYLSVSYNKKLSDDSKIVTYARYFDNSESGEALYGEIDSQALSWKGIWMKGNHTVDMGYQQMFGDHGNSAAFFPTLAGWVPQPYLDNWSVASFIRKDEKSWSLGYTYNFKDVGVPGLTTTVRHYSGWNIDGGAGQPRGKEDENNLIVNYVVPEGKLKGLGFQWMYIDVNYHDVRGFLDLDEHRISTTYTYKF